MNEKQLKAYEWIKSHDYYRSMGVRCALELVDFIDGLISKGVIAPLSKEATDD
jgi:hypothetical protein